MVINYQKIQLFIRIVAWYWLRLLLLFAEAYLIRIRGAGNFYIHKSDALILVAVLDGIYLIGVDFFLAARSQSASLIHRNKACFQGRA